MREQNYYALEIIDPVTVREVKSAYLVRNELALLLLENLSNAEEEIEFIGRMRFNPEPVRDENEQSIGDDDNILEITSIKKVIA